MSNSILKVTVYKIKEMKDFDNLTFSGYTKVAEGEKSESNQFFEYKLFFLNHFTKTPDWFNVFSNLDISKNHIPVSQMTGFIMLVKLSKSYYAFTGGIGHIRLRETQSIEPRFGVTLAEKILSLPELKGLTQKDTSGVVNFVDRVFRSKYNPNGDVNNLRRILKNVRGKISEKNKLYVTIGKSIQAGNALTVSGAKTFNEMLKFLITVDDLLINGQRTIHIPQLQCIEKRFEADLINRLESKLVEDICGLSNNNNISKSENSLFLDNEDMGYLPDRITKYELKIGRIRKSCDTFNEVFIAAGEILNQLNKKNEKIDTFHHLQLYLTFDDGITEQKDLFYFICGDVILDNEYYFVNNKLWYKANDEYINQLTTEIDNIQFIAPDTLKLNKWDETKHTGINGEFRYNQSNSSFVCLDHKTIKIDGENGAIEFCDLLKENNGSICLIHVKKDSGAALRALFAQGYVSSELYAEDNQFRTKVHDADLKQEAPALSDNHKKTLANLSKRKINQFQIIYAIYDNTNSHRIPKNPQTTSDWLNGTLTTFAKVDLINRVSSMRAKGYSVAVTRIKPYPV